MPPRQLCWDHTQLFSCARVLLVIKNRSLKPTPPSTALAGHWWAAPPQPQREINGALCPSRAKTLEKAGIPACGYLLLQRQDTRVDNLQVHSSPPRTFSLCNISSTEQPEFTTIHTNLELNTAALELPTQASF